MTTHLRDLVGLGMAKLQEEHTQKEKGRLGKLRVGEAGVVIREPDGSIGHAGKCMRKSLLRLLGYEGVTDYRTRLGFESGFGNEMNWENNVLAGLEAEGKGGKLILGEDALIEIPFGGTTLVGHPDLTIEYPDKKLGVELKGFQSMFSCSTRMQGQPELSHMAQSAMYLITGEFDEYELAYCNRSVFHTGVISPKFRKNFEELVAVFPSYFDLDKGTYPKRLLQFKLYIPVWYEEETLWFKMLDDLGNVVYKPRETIITQAGVQEYHLRTLDAKEDVENKQYKKPLPPRPVNLDVDGCKGKWKHCNYCDIKAHCDSFERDPQAWIEKLPMEGKYIYLPDVD